MKLRLDAIAILVSFAAAGFTGLQWWEARETKRLANDATISLDVDTDPSDRKLGIGVRNVGPGVATITSVKYSVDKKVAANIDDSVEEAQLDPVRFRSTDIVGDHMGPGEIIWIASYNAHKTDQDRAADFFENHLNVRVDYCSAGGRCGAECSETGGCPAGK